MKSYDTSFSFLSRFATAAAVALTAGGIAFAQTSYQDQNSSATSSTSSAYDNSGTANGTMPASSGAENRSDMNMSTNASGSASSNSKLSWSDKHFINKTAEGNQEAIELAKLAVDHANSPDVRNFAQKVITDHTKLANDLQELASSNGVSLKTKNKESHEYRKLSKASGADFDREFVDAMVKAHKKDIRAFKDRADDSKDAAVQSFVQSALPTLQQHLQAAQQLQQSIVPTGRNGSQSWKAPSSTSQSTTTGVNSTATSSAAAEPGMSSSTGSTATTPNK